MAKRTILQSIVLILLIILFGSAGEGAYSQDHPMAEAMDVHGSRSVTTPLSQVAYLPLVVNRYPPIPERPTILPIDNTDGDSSFTVRWGVAALAETYELEERWQGGEWMMVHSGTATQVDLSQRPPGLYEYRLRAGNSWGLSSWSDVVSATVAGDPPAERSRPPSSSKDADGMSVVSVVNDCPYALRLDFTGPDPQTLALPECEVCHVYSFMGPIFCPTANRPTGDTQLVPGTYRVFVSVDAPDVRPYVGHWDLEADRRYFLCFYIVRRLGTNQASESISELVSTCQ